MHDIIMVNTHLSKPTECKTPSTKLALWSLLTIDEATLTHLMDHSWGVLIKAEAVGVWRQGAHGNALYFLLSFALNLELL